MIPFDGTGFGRSLYWEMKAKDIARKKHEFCPCWENHNPVVELSTDGSYTVLVQCFNSGTGCLTDFSLTNEKMSKLFKKFYKG